MSTIVGIVDTNFRPKDSDTAIEGKTLHVTEPISPDRGVGVSTDHFFLSRSKLSQLPFTPSIGMEIEPLYTKWGRIGTLRLLSDDEVID